MQYLYLRSKLKGLRRSTTKNIIQHMRKIVILVLVSLSVFTCYAKVDQSNIYSNVETRQKPEKTQTSWFKLKTKNFYNWSSFKTIDGGTFVSRDVEYPMEHLGKNDSNIILFNYEHEQIRDIQSFALSNHEVTNHEYRMFVNWVKDYTAKSILSKVDENYLIPGTNKVKRNTTIDWENPVIRDSLFFEPYLSFDSTWNFNPWMLTYVLDTPIHIYPDTLVWMTDFYASFNGPMSKRYFWHPAYNDYPVVGVSWFQAKAYCSWLTYRLAEEIYQSTYGYKYEGYLEENDSLFYALVSKYQIPQFHLPTAQEMEWAMLSGMSNKNENPKKMLMKDMSVEHWIFLSMTEWANNFGEIIDETGLILKTYMSDGFLYPCNVKEYKPDANGIYNLHGNVAEWTESGINSINTLGIELSDDTSTAVRKIWNSYDTTITKRFVTIPKWFSGESLLYSVHHNLNLINQVSNGKIVKGGSWVQGLRYMLPHTCELYSPSEHHSFIGFRVSAVNNPFNGKRIRYRYQD
jgi:formylglycine-generating enzyme required for sulfatase activity